MAQHFLYFSPLPQGQESFRAGCAPAGEKLRNPFIPHTARLD
jgi:hypothetical protein